MRVIGESEYRRAMSKLPSFERRGHAQNDPNAFPNAIATTSAMSGPTNITIAMSR
jgi:hypothetical protein